MTEQQKLNEIITLFTFLQIHIQNYVNQSFTDLTFSLENVIKDYLNVYRPKTQTEFNDVFSQLSLIKFLREDRK